MRELVTVRSSFFCIDFCVDFTAPLERWTHAVTGNEPTKTPVMPVPFRALILKTVSYRSEGIGKDKKEGLSGSGSYLSLFLLSHQKVFIQRLWWMMS